MKTLRDKIAEFSVDDQREIKALADEMILETGLQLMREELQFEYHKKV